MQRSDEHGLNWQYYRDRLEDRTLLDEKAVIVASGDTAVPVGGKRRGGFVGVNGPQEAAIVVAQLSQYKGFPNLQIHIAPPDADWQDTVDWGDEMPIEPEDDDPLWKFALWDIQLGQYYGYADYVIRAYVCAQWGRPAARDAWRYVERHQTMR